MNKSVVFGMWINNDPYHPTQIYINIIQLSCDSGMSPCIYIYIIINIYIYIMYIDIYIYVLCMYIYICIMYIIYICIMYQKIKWHYNISYYRMISVNITRNIIPLPRLLSSTAAWSRRHPSKAASTWASRVLLDMGNPQNPGGEAWCLAIAGFWLFASSKYVVNDM